MVSVSRTVRVNAPVEETFTYVDEPENHVEMTPSIAEVSNVEPLENGGKRLDYTYKMVGVPLTGSLEAVEYEPDERIVFEMDGDLSGTLTWEFEADGDATRVTYAAEYDLPDGVLKSVAEPFAVRYNERELRTTLANLRDRIELGTVA
ncbi:SRPBCC family protein [Halobacteriales archaeon QS_6_71_20]|nr:MAG: SRPBCC family protein [Halobacteriales archaeon QS_6_71_20]